jgi:hypothetical protein
MAKRNISESKDTGVSNSTEKVQKRFKMKKAYSDVVFEYRRILSGKRAKEQQPEPVWEDALEDLIETHPALKKFFNGSKTQAV